MTLIKKTVITSKVVMKHANTKFIEASFANGVRDDVSGWPDVQPIFNSCSCAIISSCSFTSTLRSSGTYRVATV